MKVSELYGGPFVGADLFVIGTGSSMSLFPVAELEGKTCLLLNDASRYFPKLGPIAMANNKKQLKFISPTITTRIVKGRLRFDPNPTKTDNHVPWDDPTHYVFSYREPIIDDGKGGKHNTGDSWSHLDERALWREPDYYFNVKGGSISIFAIQFALLAGVRSITLVGCDCAALNGEHYTAEKAEKKNMQAAHDYAQYAVGLTRMWQEAQKRGVPLTSWTPFFGLGYHDEQYKEMSKWRTR